MHQAITTGETVKKNVATALDMKNWTKAMDDVLREEYPHTKAAALAEKLSVTVNAVNQRAFKIGIRKRFSIYRLYRGNELIATGTVKELSEELFIEESTIRCYATKSTIAKAKKSGKKLYAIKDRQ